MKKEYGNTPKFNTNSARIDRQIQIARIMCLCYIFFPIWIEISKEKNHEKVERIEIICVQMELKEENSLKPTQMSIVRMRMKEFERALKPIKW